MLAYWTLIAGGTFVHLKLWVYCWNIFETVLAILRIYLVGNATPASQCHTMATKIGCMQSSILATAALVLDNIIDEYVVQFVWFAVDPIRVWYPVFTRCHHGCHNSLLDRLWWRQVGDGITSINTNRINKDDKLWLSRTRSTFYCTQRQARFGQQCLRPKRGVLSRVLRHEICLPSTGWKSHN